VEIHFPVELQGQIEKAIVSGELRALHFRLDRFDYVAALWPSAKTLVEQFQSRA